MTDVQIGVGIVSDAYQNNFDTALLVSGDIDLVPSVEMIKSKFPNKRVIVVFPPMRSSDELRGAAHGYIHITEQVLKKSLLPEQIATVGGYVLERPSKWR